LHSKTMIVDDYLSVIGSANLDFRSFEHNFEINAYMYDPELSVKMRNIYHFDENKCERVIPVMWFRRPLRKKIAESVMRLFSPLL
ncbi:MAG: phospholipase D-like domain-containing protein, partial [Tannerellaceae bacterium]